MITLSIPGSKSDTQRALFIACLSEGRSCLKNPLICDDSRYLMDILRLFGATFTWNRAQTNLTITGMKADQRGLPLSQQTSPIFLGNAGTAVRFSSALSLISTSPFTLTGDEHMQKRPMADMIDVLSQYQVIIQSNNTCLPLTFTPAPPQAPTEPNQPLLFSIDTKTSSQYLSGLLMVLPLLQRPCRITLLSPTEHLPYVDMTLKTMAHFGVTVNLEKRGKLITTYSLSGGIPYHPSIYQVEGDWSSASYHFAASFILNKAFTISNLPSPQTTLQGDCFIKQVFESMKAAEPFQELSFSMGAYPDIIPSVVIMACHRQGKTTISGANTLKYKECDRAAVLVRELTKVGADLSFSDDQFTIIGGKPLQQNHPIDPEDDHRMAMALRTVLLPQKECPMINPGCVTKSYPHFFQDMEHYLET